MDIEQLTSFFQSHDSLSTIQKKIENKLEKYSINNSSFLSLLQLQEFFFVRFNLKIEKNLLKDFLDKYSKENKVTEKDIQIRLAKELNGEMEVKVAGGTGRIDILTKDEIIEVKKILGYKAACGQLRYYSSFFKDKTLRFHGYGNPGKCFSEIYQFCKREKIRLTYESI